MGEQTQFTSIPSVWLLISCVILRLSNGAELNQMTLALSSSILSDVRSFNMSCFPKDTCFLNKTSRISDFPDWEKRNCLCDEVCSLFGDCCPDSKWFGVKKELFITSTSSLSCLRFKQYGYSLVVTKCPDSWPQDDDVALSCTNEPTELQLQTDPIMHMPVTSEKSGITYRNVKCAECHLKTLGDEELSHLRFWNPRLECTNLLAGNPHVSKLQRSALLSKVRWDEDQKLWGLKVDPNGLGAEEFYPCFIDPALPDDLDSQLRSCLPSIQDCPSDWLDDGIREKCRSYTSVVYQKKSVDNSLEIFRNVHCALCNGVKLAELQCNSSGVSFRQATPMRDFSPSAFALLFDMKDSDGSGLVGQKKSCQAGQLYDPFAKTCRQVYCLGKDSTFRDGRCYFPVASSDPSRPDTAENNATERSPTPVDNTSETSTATTTVTPGVISLHAPEKPGIMITNNADPSNAGPILQEETPLQTEATNHDTSNSTINPFVDCPKFLLNEDEVEWFENQTIYVETYKKFFLPGEFDRTEFGFLVCANGSSTVAKFDPVLGWVTVAGLGLSEICLAIHLLAFASSAELRNLSGKNLASFSFALFMAYGSFIAAQFINTGTLACFTVAVTTLYFFLAAFWWTSVLAWDVWRTIRLATVQLRCSTSSNQARKFLLYSCYAWLVPGLIILAPILIDHMEKETFDWVPLEYRPHLGRHVCWFGQRKANLVFFGIPVATVLLVNLLLFIGSTYMIRSTTTKSPTSSNPAGPRKQLGLYVRLALIMGLSWIAGLVAGVADLVFLWYVFVGMCTLQGVFLLMAYAYSPKVGRSIRNRLLPCMRTKRHSTSAYRAGLVDNKAERLRRLGLEAHRSDSHDSHASQTSQNSQTSQTSLTRTNSATIN